MFFNDLPLLSCFEEKSEQQLTMELHIRPQVSVRAVNIVPSNLAVTI